MTGLDLFDNPEKIPEQLRQIIDKYQPIYLSGEAEYKETQALLSECQEIGYTFEYGLDNEPTNLRKIL